MPAAPDWRRARIAATQDLTPDIRLLAVEPEGAFVAPTPGSHIQVGVQVEERADTRSYSVVDAGRDGLYRIAVKRLPTSRGGSRYMWSLAAGARLTVSAPANHFELALGRSHYTLVAGGIGITPIRSMALALAEAGADLRLIYAARTRADLAFADELSTLLGERLQLVVSEEGERIDLDATVATMPACGELYLCGPIGLIEAGKRVWAKAGRPAASLRFETFGSSGRYATLPFTVRIPRLGLEIPVPENRTMLDAMEDAGVAMIHDCRRGECGLCAVHILDAAGPVDHRDVFFSDEEKAANAKLCTCVSRLPGGVLTIDTADRAA
ncbi:PDR/VanB family oxidoreductase [Salinarimonas soli]|uniref:Oxidoreductase n=1 Tax=Salinarimonas soli TaxID=1638099 RepID=A0A5B2V9D3_9HYPH|nr:PDR/VanB family oxidoreductase [Salinarimonas soli]KAA2235446.1 oxidoreductase [Salinarimonas soli]